MFPLVEYDEVFGVRVGTIEIAGFGEAPILRMIRSVADADADADDDSDDDGDDDEGENGDDPVEYLMDCFEGLLR